MKAIFFAYFGQGIFLALLDHELEFIDHIFYIYGPSMYRLGTIFDYIMGFPSI